MLSFYTVPGYQVSGLEKAKVMPERLHVCQPHGYLQNVLDFDPHHRAHCRDTVAHGACWSMWCGGNLGRRPRVPILASQIARVHTIFCGTLQGAWVTMRKGILVGTAGTDMVSTPPL